MNELKLEVDQKCWSIQLGDCVIDEIDYADKYLIKCCNLNGKKEDYSLNKKRHDDDYYQSLFESNPFDQSVKPNDMVENKADLINALFNVLQNSSYTDLKIIAEEKLKKLLEEI